MRIRALAAQTLLVAITAAVCWPAPVVSQDLELLSTDGSGQLTSASSSRPFISGNGRFVVFESSFLLPADTTGGQVYLRDRETGVLELISVNPSGNSINNSASLPDFQNAAAVSDNGRYVVFRSQATDVVATPSSGGFVQLYLRDRTNDTTSMVSIASDGTPANGNVFHFALAPNSGGVFPSRNGDGSRGASQPASIAFNSTATNLDEDDTDPVTNTFFHENNLSTTRVGCLDKNGALIVGGCNQFAWNGSEIVFTSPSRLVTESDEDFNNDIFYALPFVSTGNVHVTQDHNGANSDWNELSAPSISNEGSVIAFASQYSLLLGDPTDTPDVWIYRVAVGHVVKLGGQTENLPSVPAALRMSSNGGWLAIQTGDALDPTTDTDFQFDVYLTEVPSATSGFAPVDWTLISQNQGVSASSAATFPGVGNFGSVVFASAANNLAPIPDNNFVSDVFASAPLLIFADGFESGNTNAWQ